MSAAPASLLAVRSFGGSHPGQAQMFIATARPRDASRLGENIRFEILEGQRK